MEINQELEVELTAVDEEKELIRKQKKIQNDVYIRTAFAVVFLGGFGAHRFVTGKNVTGFLMLLTSGGCGIWWLIDVITILSGNYKDNKGIKVDYDGNFFDHKVNKILIFPTVIIPILTVLLFILSFFFVFASI